MQNSTKAAVTAAAVAAVPAASAAALFSAWMLQAAHRPAIPGAPIVVLGARVVQDRPCRMLRARLDAAADYLAKYPKALCVVSGGQGENEAYSEAHVMKEYLVGQCRIAPERIIEEDKSVCTRENLFFSAALLRERGMGEAVNIATQGFHQYRAAAFARAAGFTAVGACSCECPAHLFPFYWTRECAAICRMGLLGY